MSFIPLSTNRLLLRKVMPTDAPFVLEGLSNDLLTQHMLIHYYTLEQVQQQMDFYANHYAQQTGCYWVMQLQQSQTPIGIIGLNNIHLQHKKAELGFWVLPQFWNKGYTSEAVPAVLQYGFGHLQLNRIEATVETENLASMTVLQKANMQHEGTCKQYEYNNGKYIDLMFFAILRQDYLSHSTIG